MQHKSGVPSDWYSSAYRRRCDLCGRTYHASEGGCCCAEDLDPCACGRNQWTRRARGLDLYPVIVCDHCETEPGTPPDPDEDDPT